MEFYKSTEAAIISLLFLLLVFLPMEKVFPAKFKQKLLRPSWILDLCYFFGQYLIWGTLVLWAMNYFRSGLESIVPENFRTGVASQPWWLQASEVVILSDFIIYWGHRLQHKVDFLWRFHKVHHSAEHLDFLAAHREHPLDSIYTVGLINLPAFILGFPLEMIAGLIAFRGIWAIYIHSNVRLPSEIKILQFRFRTPFDRLKIIIGAPELHHWHHDLERDRGNYANISPIMDVLFGTYVCPDHEPEKFGIKEAFPKHYAGQMLHPMLPKTITSKLFRKTENPAADNLNP